MTFDYGAGLGMPTSVSRARLCTRRVKAGLHFSSDKKKRSPFLYVVQARSSSIAGKEIKINGEIAISMLIHVSEHHQR